MADYPLSEKRHLLLIETRCGADTAKDEDNDEQFQ
jgi:hypothetical protein